MSGYLGYDPALVDQLGIAMIRSLDELDGIRCSEHGGEGAMRAVALARTMLRDTWLPFVVSLRQCRALVGYQPATIDPGDVVNSWLGGVAAERRWQVLTDPLGTATIPAIAELTVDQARALGVALSGRAGKEPMTADEITWLASAFARISAHADLVAAFLPAMTTTGWTAVCNQLGQARQQLVADANMYGGEITAANAAGWAGIDTVFASLGAIVARDRAAHPESDATLLVADMSPYSGALLVSNLDLDADALARVSRELIEREQTRLGPPNGLPRGPLAADLLFETMLDTHGAPTAYVMLTLDAPELVYTTTDDHDLADRLIRAGTDPNTMQPDQAAVAIPTLVRWILAASSDHSPFVRTGALPVRLADLVVPYLLPVLRPTSNGYGLTDDERRRLQILIISDGAALQHVLGERDRIGAGLAAPPPSDVDARIGAVKDIAELLGYVDTMRTASAIQSAEQAQAEWELMWTVVGGLVSLIPLSAPYAVATGVATAGLRAGLEAAGVGPRSVASVRAETLQSFATMTTVASAVLLCSTFDSMVANGQVPPDAEPPPVPDLAAEHPGLEYDTAVLGWLQRSGFEDAVQDELNGTKQQIASTHEMAVDANCAILGC